MFTSACKKDDTSKELIADVLLSDYTLEADFIFSKGESTLDGKLMATKNDTVRIDLLSPDSLNGISVESDSSGKMSNYIVSFSGIKTGIPKDVLEKLSLAFSMFAPDIPSTLKKLDKNAFTPLKDGQSFKLQGVSDISPITASFKNQQISYNLTYDLNTGIPLQFIASFGDTGVTLNITKFKSHSK